MAGFLNNTSIEYVDTYISFKGSYIAGGMDCGKIGNFCKLRVDMSVYSLLDDPIYDLSQNGGSETVIGTLPEALRPLYYMEESLASFNHDKNTCVISINPTGEIKLRSIANATYNSDSFTGYFLYLN